VFRMSVYLVVARRTATSAGYLVEADSVAEALEIANTRLPAEWVAVRADLASPEVASVFKDSGLVLCRTRH
jgi:hypothetical protein